MKTSALLTSVKISNTPSVEACNVHETSSGAVPEVVDSPRATPSVSIEDFKPSTALTPEQGKRVFEQVIPHEGGSTVLRK